MRLNRLLCLASLLLPGFSSLNTRAETFAFGSGSQNNINGATSASLTDGLVFTGAYPTTNTVTVTIGNTPASVLFAGLVGPGLYQINVVVPPSLGDGDYAVVASVSGSSSQANAMAVTRTVVPSSSARFQAGMPIVGCSAGGGVSSAGDW